MSKYRPDPRHAEFVDRLVKKFDIFKPLLTEHLEDHFGELLAYLLMARVTDILVDKTLAGEIEWVRTVLQSFDEEFSEGDENITNLIALGFLENLPMKNEKGSEIRDLLGPHLVAEVLRFNW